MDYGTRAEEAEYDARTGEPSTKWSETTIGRFVQTLPGDWTVSQFLAVWEGFSEGYAAAERAHRVIPGLV